MSGVIGKIVDSHKRYMDLVGLSFEDMVRTLAARHPDDPAFRDVVALADPKRRLPWNSFAKLEREFGLALRSTLGEEWPERYVEFIMRKGESILPFTSTAAFLAWNAYAAYKLNNLLLGPSMFGDAVVPALEKLPDGKLKLELRIRDGYEDCPTFFEISKVGIRKFPVFMGLGESIVECEIRPRHATYFVTPPPARSLIGRFWQFLRIPFVSPTIINELTEQERQLRDYYERLVRSEAALQDSRRELEKRELTEKIHQLQKIEAVGTLVGGISHEMNNVLHGTLLSIDLAERALATDHPARERVLMAKRFTERGQALMKQVLAFSRKSRLEFKAVPIVDAIEEAIQLMRTTLPKSIAIELDVTALDPQTAVLSDVTQLQQVMINLGSNAAYAMRKEGGTLKITLASDPNRSEVALKVADSGEGIAEEARARIFEPFFTTKPTGEGTGVGLSVVHGIVTAHSGRISVASDPGRGTEFTIVLPTAPLDLHEDQLADLTSLGGTERILVVDDEVDLLDVLGDTLGAFGYGVSKATTAAEALAALEKESFDLVLTDYSMPGKNGIDLAREVRTHHPSTKIILCTGYRDLFGSEAGESDLIDAKVSKPLDALALNREIRSCLSSPATSVRP